MAEETAAELERQVERLSRAEIIRKSLADYGMIIVCRCEAEMIALANELAPEHMEIMTANPLEYIGKIDNVGSLFLGQHSPEPLGDYFAGPNHVLPTSGHRAVLFTARGGQLPQAVELPLLHPRGARRGAGAHRAPCRQGGAHRPRKFCQSEVPRCLVTAMSFPKSSKT